MSTRFEHRATYSQPVATVYSTLVDRAFLEERLRALGGKGAAVLDFTVYSGSGEEVRLKLRQGMDADKLPGAVRTILRGDLIVERDEHWRLEGSEHIATGAVTMSGVPGEIKNRIRIGALPDGGSEVVTTAEVRIDIMLIGKKIEVLVAEQVGKLLAAEAEFAGKYLAER
jgi:hypothetical protein